MKNISYEIKLYSPWHCGSGLSAGADVDALVVKDKNGLPFVPGKTIKGLLREAVENYCEFLQLNKEKEINEAFGRKEENLDDEGKAKIGICFFGNATMLESEAAIIKEHHVQEYLYTRISSTAIDKNGIAKDNSLRRIEAVVPCTLKGSIYHVEDGFADIMVKSMGMVKRLGQSRNRGMGRCDIKATNE